MVKISVIIINWNSGDVLCDCLKSVYDTVSIPLEVIVVDNGSSDDSISMIKKKFADIILVEEKDNLGFSKANNIGFRYSKGEYILILNPDVVLLKNAVNIMVKFFEIHPEIGILGPRILDKNKNISRDSKSKLPSLLGDFLYLFLIEKVINWASIKLSKIAFIKKWIYSYYEKSEECERLSGSCLLLKRGIFESLRGFDENFPMYLDDIDLCYRSRKTGKKNFYLADAEVMHIGQYSTKKVWNYKRYDIMSMQARLFYYKKHFGIGKSILYKAIVMLSIPYLLILDILSLPYFLFTKRITEKMWVIEKHFRYFGIVAEK